MTAIPHEGDEVVRTPVASAAYETYRILQIAFVVVPIIAGVDKFLDVLGNWDAYLAPAISGMAGGNTHAFMMAVGVVEIVAGIGVILKPRYFGYIVALWLLGIIVNLSMLGAHFDVALRDVGLCLGALALARLAQAYDRGMVGGLYRRRGM